MTKTPFRSSKRQIRPEWIDYNGHMNMAYYAVIFDEAADEVYPQIGFGPEDGWCAATGEAMGLHVDQSGPKVAPMPANILSNLKALHDAHKELPRPERSGRRIAISRRI